MYALSSKSGSEPFSFALFWGHLRWNDPTGKISFRNNAIDEVKSTKFLGVIIDDKLKSIKNKISKSIGIFIKIRPYLDKVTLRNLYFTFVYPYLICVLTKGSTCRKN